MQIYTTVCWNLTVIVTGGILELTKYFWVDIVWKWKSRQPCIERGESSRCNELIFRESDTTKKLIISKKTVKNWKRDLKFGVTVIVRGVRSIIYGEIIL